ncbi:MAG TPA: hypothetical protein VK203_18070, partial [Nostocaceae cyanobacterium]|nr:hypothetical protein [Nostocaceae cyanobacterium]
MSDVAERIVEDEEIQEFDETLDLSLEIINVRSMLQRALLIKQAYQDGLPLDELLENFPEMEINFSEDTPLSYLCRVFKLSLFEKYVILLAAGVEIDPILANLCAEVQGNELLNFPTIRLALDVLPEETWSAFTAEAALRKWQLIEIEVQSGQKFTLSPIQIDSTILFYLLGQGYSDRLLIGITESIPLNPDTAKPLQPSHQQIAQEIAAVWSDSAGSLTYPLIQLCGSERIVKQSIVAAACMLTELNLSRVSVASVSGNSLQILKQRWERAARITDSVLLIDCDELNSNDSAQIQALTQLLETVQTPVVITSWQRQSFPQRSLITFDIPPLTQAEQLAEWRFNLGNRAIALDNELQILASQFNLNASTIQAVCVQAISQAANDSLTLNQDTLWHLCRLQARPGLDHLAKRIETKFTWD